MLQIDILPWIEKYRPHNFENVISHKNTIDILQNFIKSGTMPHLLFYGPPGTGKTSIINVCAKKLYGDQYDLMVLSINASEERGIEVVRTNIIQFVSTKNVFCDNPNMFKLVILDEADAMTTDAQAILRKVIEKYTANTRFCLICNYIKKINIALQSRCTKFRFSPLLENAILFKMNDIVKAENININERAKKTIIKRANGDMRKILNILQVTSMAYNEMITEQIVNRCIGYPTTLVIDKLYNSLLFDSFDDSYELFIKIKSDYEYSLNDILFEIHDKLVNYLLVNNDKKILKIISLLSEIEYNVSYCTSDILQMTAIIGIFKLIR